MEYSIQQVSEMLGIPIQKLRRWDELGVLTESFNTMTAQLAEAQQKTEESRRATETTRAYLESILGNLSAGVLAFDDRYRLRTANASAAVILQQPLAELTGAHLHVAHISTAGAVRLVRDAKARGVRVTAEVTPHHLLLTDEVVRSYDSNYKMAPPLRGKRDLEACLEALVDGTIDCVATDHAPHALSEKEGEFAEAANGIVGLETAVPLLLDRLVRPGALDLPTLVTRLSTGPARLLNLPGGSLAPGAAADVTILDLERSWTVDPATFRSRGRNTPFAGLTGTGAPWMTLVGGVKVAS